ncbi:hypothetical protein UlMin_018874 [Ulmus minor]
MRPPPSLHSNFFSSLKQVEKRLKLEQPSQTSIISSPPPPPPPIPLESHNFSEESVISPLYLDFDQSKNSLNSLTCPESSEIPRAFLSCSPQFMLTHENPIQPNCLDSKNTIDEGEGEVEVEAVDDIEQLIQLLGLSDFGEKEGKGGLGLKGSGSGCNSCHCEDGFYSKIAGVKGPKCEKEVERLEGWIKYFLNGGGEEKMEPLRLSLLLLGKAAFVSEDDDGGFGGLDFPSTIDDFLMNDPPTI